MSKISLKHSGGNVVSLNSPTSAPTSADVAFKLPNADGTNGQVLKTDGSGNLSFGEDTGGKILQVLQGGTNTAASSSVASQAIWDIGIEVSITPANASNKILLQGTFSGSTSNAINNFNVVLQKKTGSGSFANITAANGAADGNKTSVLSSTFQDHLYTNFTVAYSYLDTAGSTDALSYRIVYYNTSSNTRTIYRNRAASESDDYGSVRGGSWIQALEVAA